MNAKDFTDKQKLQCVVRIMETSINQVSKKTGISRRTLSKWKEQFHTKAELIVKKVTEEQAEDAVVEIIKSEEDLFNKLFGTEHEMVDFIGEQFRKIKQKAGTKPISIHELSKVVDMFHKLSQINSPQTGNKGNQPQRKLMYEKVYKNKLNITNHYYGNETSEH